MSDFFYTPTSSSGTEMTGLPTPIILKLTSKDGEFDLKVTGTDGQQVTDAVTTVLKQMPCNKDRGLREFFLGLALCTAFCALVALYTIPRASDPAPVTVQGGLAK